MSVVKFKKLSTIGVTETLDLVNQSVINYKIGAFLFHKEVVAIPAATFILEDAPDNSEALNGVFETTGLAIGGAQTDVQVDAFGYNINGVNYTKDAEDGILFSENYTVGASNYGAFAFFIDDSGVITTEVQKKDQTYANAAAAHADIDIRITEIKKTKQLTLTYVGKIVFENNGSLWTANTNNLNSEVTAAGFFPAQTIYKEINSSPFSAQDLIEGHSVTSLIEQSKLAYPRMRLTVLTGIGEVELYISYAEKIKARGL
jgi:hypothetical protein